LWLDYSPGSPTIATQGHFPSGPSDISHAACLWLATLPGGVSSYRPHYFAWHHFAETPVALAVVTNATLLLGAVRRAWSDACNLHRTLPRFPEEVSVAAAVMGNTPLLEWAAKTGHPLNARVARAAASGGHLECLKFILKSGCDMTGVCVVATRGSWTACVAYLLSAGAERSSLLCAEAARFGHVDTLRCVLGCVFVQLLLHDRPY
jgi:ankyrin repeat protein